MDFNASTIPTPLPEPAPPSIPDFFAIEEIRGPVFGYYVAAYAFERPEGFYAYAKICRKAPVSVWETPDATAILSVGPCGDPYDALEDAFTAVRRRLGVKRWNLPTLPAGLPPHELKDLGDDE
jgi:hypothetical protein